MQVLTIILFFSSIIYLLPVNKLSGVRSRQERINFGINLFWCGVLSLNILFFNLATP